MRIRNENRKRMLITIIFAFLKYNGKIISLDIESGTSTGVVVHHV